MTASVKQRHLERNLTAFFVGLRRVISVVELADFVVGRT
jgi:hypothetical protein